MTWYEEAMVKGWVKKEKLPISKPVNNSPIQAQADHKDILNKMRFPCPVCYYVNYVTFPIIPDKVYTCPHCKTDFKMEMY